MKFKALAITLEKLEKTSSRIEITKILADLFLRTDQDEIDKVVYLLLGKLAPSYAEIVFNLAERMMLRVIAQAYQQDVDKVRLLYRKMGDLGETAFLLAKMHKRVGIKPGLEVKLIFDRLVGIAKDEGEKSQERKITKMAELLGRVDPLSARYLARIPIGKLRLGFSDKTILDALSWMEKGDKSEKNYLEKAYFVLPDAGLLAKEVKKYGIRKAAQKATPVIGVPLLPMLAQRIKKPTEMIAKMHEVAVEPKFDGLRIQIHYSKDGFGEGKQKVKTYTRNLNETSWMFPELKSIGKYIKAKTVILDCEAIGFDEKLKALANFQTTMTRRRKYDIGKVASKVAIKFYVFDILLSDKKSFLNQPYLKRREELNKVVKSGKLIEVDEFTQTKDPRIITQLIKKYLAAGMEGVVVKKVDGHYVAGRTGWRWVKMKEGETKLTKLADTIDGVVMGYYSGKGKRTQFGIGGFLVGVPDGEEIKTLTKIGTGLTDEQFRQLKVRLEKSGVNQQPKAYGKINKTITPDFWVAPSLVVEITADEITKSPIHSSGVALRFPRLVKFRDDKNPSQATTLGEVKKIFNLQKV